MDFDFLNIIYEEAGKIIGFIFAGVGGYYIPKIAKSIKNKIQQRFFSASLKRSVEIKVKLAEVKATIGANRIYLFQFHNGTVYLGDKSFHKYSMSAIFEVVNQGLSRIIHDYQSMPLSKYAELLEFLIENPEDMAIIGNHRGCDMTFAEADVEDMFYNIGPGDKGTLAFIEVQNNKKQFVGVICIAFETEITKTKFHELRSKSGINSLLVELRNIID